MPRTTFIIVMDDEHLGDRLFLQHFAKQLARVQQRLPPSLLVHGSGERAERLLEAEGRFPERVGGVLQVQSPDEALLVERAIREMNRKLVGVLTDEVVAAVGVHGVDKKLLRVDPEGRLVVGRIGWVEALMHQHLLPVISALAADAREPRVCEVGTVDATLRLAEALTAEDVVVVFWGTDAYRTLRGDQKTSSRSVDDVPADVVSDLAAVRRVVAAGIPVLLSSPDDFFGGEPPGGVRILSSNA